MNNFKKEGFRKGNRAFAGKPRFGGGKKFGGPSRGFDRGGRDDREERELFKATCAACHASCEVPFRPSGDKPVYCRECFTEKGGGENRPFERSAPRDDRRGDFHRNTRLERDERPARREEPAPRDQGVEDLKRQLSNLETKIDSILAAMSSQILTQATTKTFPVKESTSVTPVPKTPVAKKPKKVGVKAKAVTKSKKPGVTAGKSKTTAKKAAKAVRKKTK